MEDEECAKMFIHLQQYVPHLEKLISQLKDPKKENRELQLNKLEGLYSMITDKKKKLKIDTLRKCEDVILKILQKVNPNIVRQLKPFIPINESSMIKIKTFKEEIKVEPLHDQKYFDSLKFQAARARLNIISTPASPSPPKDSIPLVHLPIVIPTEKVKSPPDPHLFSINNWIIPLTRKESNFAPVDPPNYKTEKPDIYNKAAATLNSSPKGVVFDRLGTKVDMSKPPLSEEDLQQLTTPHREVYYEDQNLEDLEDLRQKLQKKILKTETKLHLPDLRTKLSNKDKSPSVSREEPQLPIKEKSLVLNQEKSLNQEKLQVLNQEKSPPPHQIEHTESESTKSKPNKDAEPQKIRDKNSEKSSSKKVSNKPNEEKQKKDEKSSSSKSKSSKVEKVIKDPSTQFGSLLSSIDEKILGDKKKDSGKRETSVKSDKVKVDKKDSTKKDSHSHEKKDKDSRKSEDSSKRKDHHKSRSKDHSKSSSKNSSKDKESEKHKSSHSDKHKESSSKHSSKSHENTSSNEKSESTEKSSSNVKSENSSSKPLNSDSKETHTFKRLADKYNPRPRKNSIEDVLKSPVGDARTTGPLLVDPVVSKDPRNPAYLIEFRDPRSANQRTDPRNAVHAVGDPRSTGHPVGDPRSVAHQIGDPRSAVHSVGDSRSVANPIADPRSTVHPIGDIRSVAHPVGDPRSVGHPVVDPRTVGHPVGDPRIIGHPIADRRTAGHPAIGDIRNNVHQIGAAPNYNNPVNYNANKNFFEPPINNDPYHFNKPQNSMEHNPVVVGNAHHRTLLPTPPHPIQMGFQPNNTMIRQNDFMQKNNQFIPPQQRMVNQNTLHQGNSFSNIYYKNNTNQMNNSANIPYQGPSKAFHPYEPIESSSEYDLSKMQPVDFYSPAATQPVNKITSPPTYGNRTFVPQAPRMERSREETFRLGREQNQRLQHDPRKEEASKMAASRDPRIRSREMKERSNNAAIPSKGPPASAQSKPATGEPHNKYDSLYSKLVDRKVPEMFTSPLDSLYSSGELPKTTASKGYGIQKFKIPKKKSDIKNKTKEHDQKEDSYKHDDKISDTKEPSSDDDVYEVDAEIKKPEEEKSVVNKPEEVKPIPNIEPEVIEPSPSDPKLITEFVTQMIQSSDKQKLLSTLLSSLEDSITEKQKEAMKRIKKVIECDEAEEDVSHVEVDTANDDKDVSSTTGEIPKESEEQTKTISKEAVSSDLANDVEETEEQKLDEDDSFEESDEEDKIKPKKIIKRLINTRSTKKLRKKRRRRRRRGAKKIEDLNSSFEDNVVETVSERIKNQRRSVNNVDGKPRKCRTELDMLHDDIKEMFIRDGVLTANGKRMCTMLKGDKNDSEVLPNAPPVKDNNLSKVAESEELPLDSPKRRARDSNPKVLIEKTDLSKHTSQSVDESESENEDGHIPQRRTRSSLKNKLPKRTTRSSSRAANYKEDTSDDDNKLDQSKTEIVEEPKAPEESKVSEDEFKASEDESKASEDVAIDESENITSSQMNNKKNKRKRRGYNWAAGIIHKRPKRKTTSRPVTPYLEEEERPPSEPEEQEEEEVVEKTESPEIEYTEPDKNYYFDPQMKPDCKLCSFKGRMIIQHYRSNHPKNEVLISRLSPNIADTAINESKAKNYNEFEIPPEASQTKFRRNKYTFQCRFCQVFLKNESTEAFLDHLTSHTGEYRFLCHFCSFRTANCKSLRSHMHSSHNATSEQTGGITPTYSSPPDFNTLFGYICSECNFVQMNKSAMERHSKIIHVGDFSKIYKISMSMIPSKNSTVDENLELSASKETEVEEAVPVQETPMEESAPTIDEKAIDEVKTAEIDENMNAESADKQEPEELITAFTITDDQQGEIEKCAEKKQEKMEEIQKTIIPKKRFASNLLEKLKNRLNDKIEVAVQKDVKDSDIKETNEKVKKVEDAENKTTASVEFLNDGPSTSMAEQKIEVKDMPIENDLIKKGLFDKRENKLEGITNIIERLQDKLADAQKLPTLIPIDEFNAQDVDFKPEEILCQVGPFITGKKKNAVYFVCYIKSCNFSSRNLADFKTHCTTLHCHDPWDGYCTTCDKKTNYTTAIGAYIHLFEIHAPKEISAKAKLIKEEEPEKSKPYLRMRRLSGDKLSEKSEMLIPEATIKKEVDAKDPDVEIIDETPEEEPFNFPFQITNVTSLADEEEDEKKWEVPDEPSPTNNTSNGPTIGIVLPILSSIKGSPPVPAATKPTSPRQLVVSPRAPVFTVASPQKVQSKKILLKDTPLQLDELLKPRKTKPALQALLSESKLKHLYKCPERLCHYSTDMKKHFEMHLKQHVEYNSGIQIPCLYCNFKTCFNLIGIHYDIRHSKCLFCCAYCFYRAINQSYVEIHQESEHTNKIRRVIIVPQNMDALMSQANIAIPHIRNVLTPYSCGQLGCEEKFIFEIDFKRHLATVHKGIPLLCVCCPHSPVNEEAAVVHAQTHNVYYYNCRYCVNGSNDIDDIHKHLSQTHFALPPQIIVRQFQEKRSGKLSSDFSYNDDAVFDHVLVQSNENLEYITPSARVYSGASPSVSSVHKYMQKNSPSETITLYKAPAPNPGVPIKFLKCSSNPKLKDVEIKKMNTDNEIVQVSDDDDDNEPVVPKPPIVLNSLIAQGKNILSLTNPKIINEKSKPEPVQNFISIQDFSQNSTMRVTFGPDQIDQLPIRPIFNQNIVCSTCGYESKVRANLVRHLQFHLHNKEVPVPVSAPVNPVPCLDKNEKMFDKMTNLAHSSFSDKSRMSGPSVKKEISYIAKEEESNYPCFVPSAKRYVCGAYNCQYLNQEESILRHHVETFHTDERLYKCLHCNKSLTIDNVVINVENILHHLKLHDLNLYKCKYCAFLHYQKQKIEAHVTEKHLDDRLHIVIVREMEQEPQDSPQIEEVKEKKPWRCGICKYRCTTKSEIVSHAFNKHEVEYQYNCAMCNFKSNEKIVFENHFRANHVGHQIDVNSTYYEVADTLQVTKPVETEIFDTTPLWQRDKNKFKHIRGIPLDESIKVPKKSPFKAAPVFDNLDKSIEAVANGSAIAVPKNSKAAVVKKPKTLKEKRMKEDNARAELFADNNDVDVVGLDNDEFPFELTEKCFEEKDPITIIYNGKETSRELSVKDIEEMDLNMIKTAEFSCATGRFGKPANKEYFCPICEAFKTKRVIEFTQHLYKELEYDRFVCTRCGLSNASNKVLERHSIKKHPTASLAIHPLSPDNRIEDYVNKLLAYQQRVMFANTQPEIVEKKRDSIGSGEYKTPEKCKHCSYTSKYCADLKKHEVRHWAVKPYKCGVCSFEGVTSSEVIQHSRRIHVNRLPDVITVQLPENPVIIPISRKRRYNHKIDSDASSDAFEFSESGSSDIVLPDPSDNTDNGNDEIVFVCHYCPKRGTNESEIRDHWELVHKPKSMVFKIKKVKRSDLIKPTSILYYKCGYCDLRTQFDNIRKHCKKVHPEMTFSAFRFKCGIKECNEYLKSYDHAKTHFNLSHPGSKISYIDVPKVASAAATAQINCEFCSLKFDSCEKFSLHQKEMHSHLLPSFTTSEIPRPSPAEAEVNRYKCPECNHGSCNYAAMRDHVRSHAKPFVCHYCSQRFLYPSVVKTHHNREHRDLEFKYETDDVAMKRNDYLRSNILVLGNDGTYVKNKNSKTIKRSLPSSTEVSKESTELAAPPPPKKFKATARKSTTKQSLVNNTVAEEGYSYYGCKPDLKEIGSIKASLPFLDTMVQISLSDLTFINIFPVVEVEDFKNKLRF